MAMLKWATIGYGVSAFGGALALLWWLESDHILFFIWIAWVFFCALVWQVLALLRVKRMRSVLLDDCDALAYVKRLARSGRFGFGKTARMFWMFERISAHSNAGDMDEMERMIMAVELPLKRAVNEASYALYCAVLSMHKRDFEQAKRALDHLETFVMQKRMFKRERADFANRLQFLRQRLLLMQGQSAEAEVYFSEMRERKSNRIVQVIAHASLAELYLLEGRMDEAERAHRFCLEHGGTTKFKRQAEAYFNAQSAR